MDTTIISLREHPEKLDLFCRYFSSRWGKPEIYRNCMESALRSPSPLPQWYLLLNKEEVAGGCGLITTDFISRMDLYPWLCALYVEETFRCRSFAGKLIEHTAQSAWQLGYPALYCCTDHIGFYEKYHFEYIGTGYHPWDETSRIYCRKMKGFVLNVD